jgi:hypothetical protein
MKDPEVTRSPEADPPPPPGTSGDPLLKRLVDLAKVGWEAELILLSNGIVVTGRLISGVKYRAALAQSLREGTPSGLDELVAAAVEAEDPPAHEDEAPEPEPRFIHLADVRIGDDGEPVAPYMRIRLPAVSGFWIRARRGAPRP